ncbi:hypothetical protein [Dysgonomonas reticulitermitis]
MKMKRKRILLVYSLIVWIIPSGMQAQVTVGSGIAPNSACLLELKTNEIKDPVSVTDATNITSTAGGLGLPRVQLVNLTTLEPFIPNDTDWNSNKDKIKERHAGLTVYNIKVSDAAETDPNKVFQQGIYIWNGSSWKKEGDDGRKERFFYLQPFKLPLNTGATSQTFNLYDEYKRQFSKNAGGPVFVSSNTSLEQILSGENKRLYNSNELDFAVTFFDEDILTVNSIDPGGMMAYTTKQSQPGPNPKVLINVVLVIK